MGFEPTTFKKLHSFLVAADAAYSKGDLPVVAVEIMLVAVMGLAIAADVAAVPTELAAAVPVVPSAARGAAQLDRMGRQKIRGQTQRLDLLNNGANLFSFASNVKYPSGPRATDYRFKWRIGRFVISNHFSTAFRAGKFFKFNWAISAIGADIFI